MFFTLRMQIARGLGHSEAFLSARNRLLRLYDAVPYDSLSDPIDQLIASILGGRTPDEIQRHAFARLRSRYGVADLAQADPGEIAPLIARVEFADKKAVDIVFALRRLKAISGDLSLDFLHGWSTPAALRYLEDFHGVGRTIAAATVNFSTLRKPALVLGTHVLRVLCRLGFLPPHVKDAGPAYDLIMPALEDWSAADLFEFHWLLKQLGQDVCEALRTNCRACPLETLCSKRGVRTFH
jgi:endonuclease-3